MFLIIQRRRRNADTLTAKNSRVTRVARLIPQHCIYLSNLAHFNRAIVSKSGLRNASEAAQLLSTYMLAVSNTITLVGSQTKCFITHQKKQNEGVMFFSAVRDVFNHPDMTTKGSSLNLTPKNTGVM